MAVEHKQFQPGQKIRTQYGEIRTVSSQLGCQVFVEEECSGHYHPSNLFPVEQPKTTQTN
jgi:hypothetical protein